VARADHLGGDQWGMMNETGNYPGQPWMWLYTFWYQIKPFSTSDNADALVWMLWLGIILHGICFDFFFVVGQIYIDREAPPTLRAATQGLITFITYGAGMFIGAWLSGRVVDAYSIAGANGAVTHDWQAIWMFAGICAAVVLAFFVLTFSDSERSAVETGGAKAPQSA
jgi:hypothetical protein